MPDYSGPVKERGGGRGGWDQSSLGRASFFDGTLPLGKLTRTEEGDKLGSDDGGKWVQGCGVGVKI